MEAIANGLILLMLSIGHAELWIMVINRTHALPIHDAWLKRLRHILELAIVLFPIVLFLSVGLYAPGVLVGGTWSQLSFWWKPVLLLCTLGFLGLMYSAFRHLFYKPPRQQTETQSELIQMRERLNQDLIGEGPYHYLAGLPLNQVFSVEFTRKTFQIPRLPANWEGLTILHVSDLHFSGTLKREYFVELCRIAQESKPDLIIFAGDLLDEMKCLDWLDDTLGPMQAPLGRFFILGNHDWHQESLQIRETLSGMGWIDLSATSFCLQHAGHTLQLAGTEVPWMGTHPESRRSASEENSESEFDFLLLVSHTPDNFHWAVREGYDLVLSGHTHGGQVRLPLIGPVFAPSLHGTRYASGTFARGSTMLHVSRGVSGIHPLRWFCRPEISLLTLRTTDDAAR
ncbi:metallophosphoesterase [Gimesia fumaroli]|uniref:Putative metallophosphoesterase n=1 Tax=Gimesia fumaroli TaxID=2527976 RepID=A0A518I7Q1_9PLAN|nr:metallophosphoesterase [Gimesia fumaroli]QDV49079.1 putative metallophosphoesterase [Gimesia fumaroli]